MGYLFYLVGPPGSGKRTIGLKLSALTGAALLDNHLANDPIFLAAGAGDGMPIPNEVWELCGVAQRAMRSAVLHAPPTLAHIFTNYLSADEGERQSVDSLRELAARRNVSFVPVWLNCPLPELERRMGLPERLERRKLNNPVILRELLGTSGMLPAPPDALQIDTSLLAPAEAARLIATHAGALD